ncbi:hypothetical protein REIFOR_01998 [Reinekea forsetii]|uniref:DUF11 domain-containing protein n=3 Tax=Reinekea forsetii TaxID=1336806 RepID=A0A2K8KQX2_9GAMM|nr:hypothetical protein REIFOR_01998 [Reinekea forsetii]
MRQMAPRYLRSVLGSLLSAGLACFCGADSVVPAANVQPPPVQSPRPSLPAIAPTSNTVSTPPDTRVKNDGLEIDGLEIDVLEIDGLEIDGPVANVVEVSESFYRLVLDDTGQGFNRVATAEARPGDLIELVIRAVNQSDRTLEDIELINSVPSGAIQLLADSFQWDPSKGLYRISRDGETFFQADADLDPADIHFIQWLIFSLRPAESLQLAYRIQIDP